MWIKLCCFVWVKLFCVGDADCVDEAVLCVRSCFVWIKLFVLVKLFVWVKLLCVGEAVCVGEPVLCG